MKEAVVVSIARTAVGKAPRGTLRNTRPDDMAAAVIKEIVGRVPGLDPGEIEDVIVACGAETMSLIPMGGFHFSPNPYLMDHYPDSYLNMGLTAENLARQYQITREQADQFSLRSHQRALAAIAGCKFKEEIVPLEVVEVSLNGKDKPQTRQVVFNTDEGPRRDTSLEALAKLKPAFHAQGTVTAGNSSQTSDGAAAAVVMSAEKARALGAKPLARFV